MMWGYGGTGSWMWFGPMTMLVVAGLIVGGLTMVLRTWWAPTRSHAESTPALDILDSRYAQGEITRDEYQRMRQELLGLSTPGEGTRDRGE